MITRLGFLSRLLGGFPTERLLVLDLPRNLEDMLAVVVSRRGVR